MSVGLTVRPVRFCSLHHCSSRLPEGSVAMKHAGPATLARIVSLLEELRARAVLREVRPGVFYLKSRAFLHFHDDPSGVFADIRLADEFVRLPVTSTSEQSDLLGRIDECLSTVEGRATNKSRTRVRRTRKRR